MTISRLGLDNAVLRFAAVAYSKNEFFALAGLYRRSLLLVFVSGTIIGLVIFYISPFFQLGGVQHQNLEATLYIMLFAITPAAINLVQGEFFKAIGSPGIATFFQTVLVQIILVVGTSLMIFLNDVNVKDIAIIYLIATFITLLAGVITWNHRMPELCKERGYFDLSTLLRTSFPLLLVASMNLVMSWTDILVLGYWYNADTVGVYAVATRVATLTAFVLIAVNTVTAPKFALLYAQQKHNDLQMLAQKSAYWILITGSPTIIILLFFPELILSIFGEEFITGGILIRVLAIGQFVNIAVGSVGYLLIMTGNEKLMRNNILLSAIINLFGNVILVPKYGALGAAISTALSMSVMNIISFILVKDKLQINTLGYLVRGSSGCNNH